MKGLVFSICICFSLFAHAQQTYPLHPSVGDTIDRNEKLDYSLFPMVENNSFRSATIMFRADSFFLAVNTQSDSILKFQYLSKEELIEAQKSIEKINKYYRYLTQKKEDTSSYQSELKEQKPEPMRIVDGPMVEQMKKEARMNIRLKEDARRQREIQQGTRNQQLYIGF